MRIAVRFNGETAVLSLSGKFLAGSDGPYLRQKVKDLMDAGTTKLIVDFAEVPYIDSTGLGFLAGARVTVQNAHGQIILTSVNLHVRKILDGVNLSQFFVIAANEAAAMSLLSAPPSTSDESSSRAKRPSKEKKRTTNASPREV